MRCTKQGIDRFLPEITKDLVNDIAVSLTLMARTRVRETGDGTANVQQQSKSAVSNEQISRSHPVFTATRVVNYTLPLRSLYPRTPLPTYLTRFSLVYWTPFYYYYCLVL